MSTSVPDHVLDGLLDAVDHLDESYTDKDTDLFILHGFCMLNDIHVPHTRVSSTEESHRIKLTPPRASITDSPMVIRFGLGEQ